ncbi:hypothetical protein [Corynebacterium oculi]|uniref:hypothetical protein n=1 Tax=Corynebacterium oculi TaxID=1544416 RepID=UPI0012372E34|nr:hypothetical protein [Corynebacterium oculi]
MENNKALFVKTFKLKGKWEVGKGKFLSYKKHGVVEGFTGWVINPIVYGPLGHEGVVGLIRAGRLLSGG